MLNSFGIALSVAISFHTAGISCKDQPLEPTRHTVDVIGVAVAGHTDGDSNAYVPFIDGFRLPESHMDRIARTA